MDKTISTIVIGLCAFGLGILVGIHHERNQNENVFRIQGENWHYEYKAPEENRPEPNKKERIRVWPFVDIETEK
jgi:hypothetical protein